MRVLLFGALADLAGWRERMVDPAPHRLSSLRARLAEADAPLGAALLAPGVQAAVDKVLVRGDPALTPAAEVAFMPPMSGG
jgi:molybdopterin synthase sulfur carrier subunit